MYIKTNSRNPESSDKQPYSNGTGLTDERGNSEKKTNKDEKIISILKSITKINETKN